jgi:hypothetical protein
VKRMTTEVWAGDKVRRLCNPVFNFQAVDAVKFARVVGHENSLIAFSVSRQKHI